MMNCPACSESIGAIFFELRDVPVLCNILRASQEDARGVPRSDIRLAHCTTCDLVYNAAFDEQRLTYSSQYENALHFSPYFKGHVRQLAQRLIDRYQLNGRTVLEVGCGDGQFLSLLCEMGVGRGIGYDPSYDPKRSRRLQHRAVTIHPAEDIGAIGEIDADLICCRHVLEHIARPQEFLAKVRGAVRSSRQPVFYFEVPSGLHVFKRLGIWDVIYEHVLYFSPESLANLFTMSGFDVLHHAESYGEQFIEIEAVCASDRSDAMIHCHPEMAALADAYRASFDGTMDHWTKELVADHRAGRRVALWGAGSKGVMFLNLLDRDLSSVACVVDVNARKHGRFIAGTGHSIISPAKLTDFSPDRVIVMNPIYSDEIRAELDRLGIAAQVDCVRRKES
jgi:SAM-dependent methyltransferase